MAELYLVRHGQASFGAANYDKLSELGYQQAVWLGNYFKERNLAFDNIITGSMVRHRETAEGIAEGMGLKKPDFKVYPDLNEFDFNAVMDAYIRQYPEEKLNKDAPRAAFYKLLKTGMTAWSQQQITGELPESWQNFSDRVQTAMQTIQTDYQKQKLLAVSSGGAIAMALSQILQAPAKTVIELNLQTKNTAIAHCFYNKSVMRMNGFNNTPHLDVTDRLDQVTYS